MILITRYKLKRKLEKDTPTQGYRDPNSAALLASAQENKTFVTHIRNIDKLYTHTMIHEHYYTGRDVTRQDVT